jgi:2-aminoadipate transaminase
VDLLTQYTTPPGVIDLAWGQPDPDLLPVAELRAAAMRALDRHGPDMLAYGNPWGPPSLRDWISERLRETDARAPTPDEIVITGGTSQGLDMVATLLIRPGDLVLVSEPTYHLALRILGEDHRFEVRGVRSDADGIDLDALAETVRGLPARSSRNMSDADRPSTEADLPSTQADRPRAFLYTIPTFNNPTGGSLPDERRRALADLATREGMVILEDDTYRELAYDGPTPESLWALAETGGQSGGIVRFGSFAKSVAPGLRVGYLTTDAATAERIALSGLLDSGGSPSQFAAFVVAEYAKAGDYLRGVERFREGYRKRRDALLGGLDAHLAETGVTWTRPRGGYFVWVSLPKDVNAAKLADAAARAGTGFIPDSVFFVDRQRAPNAIRLSFARYPAEMMGEATKRLGTAIESVRSR